MLQNSTIKIIWSKIKKKQKKKQQGEENDTEFEG
jgi:hypothetical protein